MDENKIVIILSYSNFLEFVLVFNVLQERNYGIYYQIKKNIEFCVPESPTTTIFTLSMFAAISWWYFNLSWSWNVSCAWTRNQIWSYFHFHFWFCLSQFGFTMYHIWSILWSVFQYFVSYSFSIVEVNVSNIRKSQRYKRPVNYRLRKILSWNRANRWDSSYQYRELLTERLGF